MRWTSAKPRDVADVDGLVVGGGDDISPDIYGGKVVTSARLDPDRDELEKDLVSAATERGVPVLGVCRGAQMINVALGGTLEQDAYGTYVSSDLYWTVLPKKIVTVLEGTKLADIAGCAPMTVNALHRQSVSELGKDLRVAARDIGGMIQAIEHTNDLFMLGVQWHPEYLLYAKRQRALFRALVDAAKDVSSRPGGS